MEGEIKIAIDHEKFEADKKWDGLKGYHRLQRRIEAHICIAFAAYKVYKELEGQLKEKKAELSPEKAIEIAKTIFSVHVSLTHTGETLAKTIYTRAE